MAAELTAPLPRHAGLDTWRAARRFRELGEGATVVGRIWAPAWRGTLRAGRNLRIDAAEEPVELFAKWRAEIRLGDDVTIEPGVSIEAQALVAIGDGVRLGARCKILDNDFHVIRNMAQLPPSQPVVIEAGARIGAGAILLPGAWVPRGAEVAPGRVVRGRHRPGAEPVPVPPHTAGERLRRTLRDRALDLVLQARAPVLLRRCEVGRRIRAGNVRVRGEGTVRVGSFTCFFRGMIPTELVAHPGARVHLGERVMFNYGGRVEAHASVAIGDRCFLGSRVVLCDRGPDGAAPIVVEDDVWLAHGVTVAPGVRIGARSIVAAGSVVTRDVPPDSIAAGAPARAMPLRLSGAGGVAGA